MITNPLKKLLVPRGSGIKLCSSRFFASSDNTRIFDRSLHLLNKANTLGSDLPLEYQRIYDLSIMELVSRQKGMKRNATFENVAVIGQNPHLFLRNIEKGFEIKHFYVCDTTEQSVVRSINKIQAMVDDGFFEKSGIIQPEHIEPKVVDEENWDFADESLCMIVSNLGLHWTNKLEQAFTHFSRSLKPNGAFLGSMLGGDTLQELRIAFNLAEGEREGGYSPTASPMMSLTDIGNIFSRCDFNLPTIDKSTISMEFQTLFHLMDFVRLNGDQNVALEKRGQKQMSTFLAAAAIYQTLFSRMTIPIDDDVVMLFDEFKDDVDYLRTADMKDDPAEAVRAKTQIHQKYNILATIELIFLVGWKYHETQQKRLHPKKDEFTMHNVVKEIEEREGTGKIKFGTVSEDTTFDEVDKMDVKVNK